MTLHVALRKESVDRNAWQFAERWPFILSLSARRAWIEICINVSILFTLTVALRKESVDRNDNYNLHCVEEVSVALRKESVDRNFYFSDKDADWVRSLSARRAWIEI